MSLQLESQELSSRTFSQTEPSQSQPNPGKPKKGGKGLGRKGLGGKRHKNLPKTTLEIREKNDQGITKSDIKRLAALTKVLLCLVGIFLIGPRTTTFP